MGFQLSGFPFMLKGFKLFDSLFQLLDRPDAEVIVGCPGAIEHV